MISPCGVGGILFGRNQTLPNSCNAKSASKYVDVPGFRLGPNREGSFCVRARVRLQGLVYGLAGADGSEFCRESRFKDRLGMLVPGRELRCV